MAPALDDLFASPDHYLHSFDGEDAVFVRMDRAAYRRSIFLDNRIGPAAPGAIRVPVAALAGDFGAPAPTAWIFHVAHCGSTLLARALGELSGGLVLREPLALRQVALSPDPARLALVLRMLGKRYPGGGPTLVKANVPVNFILPEIAAADPDARVIMLHFGLRDYLPAILRSDNHRQWLRGVTAQLAGHLGDLSRLSDAERAAALWLAQARHFAHALGVMPNARTLDAERFFAEPTEALAAAATHLDIDADDAAFARLVAGPLFATSAKNPAVAFDNAARIARRSAIASDLTAELAAAEIWLEAAAPDLADLNATIAAAALV